jgi:predicted nucleic acid-binding protein
MAEKLDQKQTVDFKELLMSEVIQSEALINLLDRKGVISKQELLEEMKRVQSTMIKSKKG